MVPVQVGYDKRGQGQDGVCFLFSKRGRIRGPIPVFAVVVQLGGKDVQDGGFSEQPADYPRLGILDKNPDEIRRAGPEAPEIIHLLVDSLEDMDQFLLGTGYPGSLQVSKTGALQPDHAYLQPGIRRQGNYGTVIRRSRNDNIPEVAHPVLFRIGFMAVVKVAFQAEQEEERVGFLPAELEGNLAGEPDVEDEGRELVLQVQGPEPAFSEFVV